MAKVRILIIEDDPDQSEILSDAVSDFDYEVTGIATNLQEAYGLFYS